MSHRSGRFSDQKILKGYFSSQEPIKSLTRVTSGLRSPSDMLIQVQYIRRYVRVQYTYCRSHQQRAGRNSCTYNVVLPEILSKVSYLTSGSNVVAHFTCTVRVDISVLPYLGQYTCTTCTVHRVTRTVVYVYSTCQQDSVQYCIYPIHNFRHLRR